MLSETELLSRLNKFPDEESLKSLEKYDIYFETLSMDGLNEMHSYSLNPKFYEFFEYDPFQEITDTENYINKLLEKNKDGTNYYWFVRRKSDDYLIGTASLVKLNYHRQSVDWGYGIDPDLWGKGSILSIQEILKYIVFELLELNRLGGITSSKNERTINSVLSTGMLHEGTIKDFMKIGDSYHDGWHYGMTRSMYKSSVEYSKSEDKVFISSSTIVDLLTELFPEDEIDENSSMVETIGWDSLGHIRVIMSIKEKLGVTFTSAEIAIARSVKSIVEIIESKNFK